MSQYTGPGRPPGTVTYKITPAEFVELLADNPTGYRKADLLEAIEIQTGEKLTNGQFGGVLKRARRYARSQGFSIPNPRKGTNFKYMLTYDANEIIRAALNHGRSSATHLETARELFLDVTIARYAADTFIGMTARVLKPQMAQMATQVRLMVDLMAQDAEKVQK